MVWAELGSLAWLALIAAAIMIGRDAPESEPTDDDAEWLHTFGPRMLDASYGYREAYHQFTKVLRHVATK